jgi:formamidopyrimidine-DNA glycosylase
MPELPDVTVYLEAIEARTLGAVLEKVRLASPFVLRTFDPPISAAQGRRVTGLRRVGKRLALRLSGPGPEFADEGALSLWLVIHLMISGRFRWLAPGAKIPGKLGLAAFDFGPRPAPGAAGSTPAAPAIPEDAAQGGSLIFTEAASKKRASLHVLRGDAALAAQDRGGLEVMDAPLEAFTAALQAERHTLKRTLTDPQLFSGIGNAFSDEILHRARLSPVQMSTNLSPEEVARLQKATVVVLDEFTRLLRTQAGGKFPEKVTAFRPEMAVHGKYRQPCPVCGTAVQRIAYADNETDYCPRCQTEGKVLSDRGLARLLKGDWPKTIEELEERLPTRAPVAGSATAASKPGPPGPRTSPARAARAQRSSKPSP